MKISRNRNEAGSVLVMSILVMLVLFGLAGSMIMVSQADSRAVAADEQVQAAFYLAEGGLAAAKFEIGQNFDADGDGLGDVALEASNGDYAVAVADLGDDFLSLTSMGSSSGASVVLQETVKTQLKSSFPTGAMSIVGFADKTKIKYRKGLDVIIDGGDSPGITVADADLYDTLIEGFGGAVQDGTMPAENIVGSRYTTLEDGSEISIILDENVSDRLTDLTPLYDTLVSLLQSMVNSSTKQSLVLTGKKATNVFGTEETPVVVFVDKNMILTNNDGISGYGTLIISHDLRFNPGSTFDWHGDVVVFADSTSSAKLRIGGDVNITGNLIVVGEGMEQVDININPGASMTVNGSMLLATDYSTTKGKRAKLDIKGKLDVNGLLTMLGTRLRLVFDMASETHINGMLQLALPPPGTPDDLRIEFEGIAEFYKDDELIRSALVELQRFGVEHNISSEVKVLISYEVSTEAWSQLTCLPDGVVLPTAQ